MKGLELSPLIVAALRDEHRGRAVLMPISLEDRARHHLRLAAECVDANPEASLANSAVAAGLLAMAGAAAAEAMREAAADPAARGALRTIARVVDDESMTRQEAAACVAEVLRSVGIY